MKNYAAIFLMIITILNVLAGTGAAQDVADSYFAYQMKLSKPDDVQTKASVPENATAPANDNFASAGTITIGASGNSILTGNNISASKETGEPNHAENAGGSSVWFNFTPPADGNYELRTDSSDTNFDTTLAVYYGNSVNSLALLGYNDDCYRTGCGTKSIVRLFLYGGITYRVAVDGYNNGTSTASGTFKMVVETGVVPYEFDNIETAYDLGTINAASIAATNYLASAQAGEPNHSGGGNDNGGNSVWYRFQVASNRAMTVQTTHDFESEIAVYESLTANPTFADLNRLDDNNDFTGAFTYGTNKANFRAIPSRYYFVVIDCDFTPGTPDTGNFQLKIYQTRLAYSMQLYDNDPMTAASVYRPSNATWYSLPYSNPFDAKYSEFGINGDTPLPADFDGDALSNYAVTRNQNGLKHWYVLKQDGSAYNYFQWGLASDMGIVGDFDRDGLADATVIREINGSLVWYVRQSSNLSARTFVFGLVGDRPLLGDFDGDGATEVAVIRAQGSNLVWYILRSNGNQSYTQMDATLFGFDSDLPAVEDFDGDGKTDIAMYRPLNGTWYIVRSGNGQLQVTEFGGNNDKPQPGDYDADGKADLAVYRPSTGDWYFWLSKNNSQKVIHWGNSGDVPISSMTRFSEPPMEE